MAQTPEGKVKAKLTKELKKLGIYYFYPATWGMGRSGIPDVVCCVNGLFVGIECKAGKNTPTALQKEELRKIESSGGKSFVCNEVSLEGIVDWLKQACSLEAR